MIPAGAVVLSASGRGGRGNSILKIGEGEEAAILKVYRRRRSALREEAGELAARIFHRKRGVSVNVRHRNELEILQLWTGEGFDVPRRLDRELPEGLDPPATWLEFIPGRLLSEILRDEGVPWEEKCSHLRRLGSEHDRRHALALDRKQPLLIQEKGSVKHVFIFKDRMTTFDFEQAFGPRFPLIEALAEELAGYLRSIAQLTGDRFDDGLEALLAGYADHGRLKKITDWGVSGGSLYRWAKRWQDSWRRPEHGKVAVLRQLGQFLRL